MARTVPSDVFSVDECAPAVEDDNFYRPEFIRNHGLVRRRRGRTFLNSKTKRTRSLQRWRRRRLERVELLT